MILCLSSYGMNMKYVDFDMQFVHMDIFSEIMVSLLKDMSLYRYINSHISFLFTSYKMILYVKS